MIKDFSIFTGALPTDVPNPLPDTALKGNMLKGKTIKTKGEQPKKKKKGKEREEREEKEQKEVQKRAKLPLPPPVTMKFSVASFGNRSRLNSPTGLIGTGSTAAQKRELTRRIKQANR